MKRQKIICMIVAISMIFSSTTVFGNNVELEELGSTQGLKFKNLVIDE